MGNFAENLNLGNRFRPPLYSMLKMNSLKCAPVLWHHFCLFTQIQICCLFVSHIHHVSMTLGIVYILSLRAGCTVVHRSSNWERIFISIIIQEATSRTTEQILGLFVLIWMYFSCWIQIWQWKFKFWIFFDKKTEMLNLSSALDIHTGLKPLARKQTRSQ